MVANYYSQIRHLPIEGGGGEPFYHTRPLTDCLICGGEMSCDHGPEKYFKSGSISRFIIDFLRHISTLSVVLSLLAGDGEGGRLREGWWATKAVAFTLPIHFEVVTGPR